MIDQNEQRLQAWLRQDASTFAAPAALQRRVLDIPASAPRSRPHWPLRFSAFTAPAAIAVVLGLAVAVTSVFNVFDRPAGTDGGLCNNRQVHRALEGLRDAPGYRYEIREELYDFDTTAEFSFDDPQYAWKTGLAAEGAYRAPDRVREVVTEVDGFGRGYVEHLQVGDTTWRRSADGDEDSWLRMPNQLPTANMVYGYVQGAFPAFEVPLVNSLDWGGTTAPDDIPGAGGCTVATRIPGDGIGDIVALRIEVGSGRPIGVYRGPPTDADVRHGALRYVFALAWSTPEEDEFVPPADAVDAPDPGAEGPVPTPVPAQTPAADAWPYQELPLPDGWSSGGVRSVVHLGTTGFVAVGTVDRSDADSYESEAVVWTSADGVTWDVEPDPPSVESFEGLAWDGETLLALGARAATLDTLEYEIWSSPDGRDWTLAASLGTDVSPAPPVLTRHGWIMFARHLSDSAEAGGGVQTTPSVLRSIDGLEWEETILPDTGSGTLTSLVESEDGTLLAFGCESPGATNTAQFGELCLTRPWRSDDGATWRPGPVLDVELPRVVADGDTLLGIGSRGEPGRGAARRLYRSDDGETWTEEPFTFGTTDELAESGLSGGPEGILRVGDRIVVEGSGSGVSPFGQPYPALWTMTADGHWEEVPIGFAEGGGSVDAWWPWTATSCSWARLRPGRRSPCPWCGSSPPTEGEGGLPAVHPVGGYGSGRFSIVAVMSWTGTGPFGSAARTYTSITGSRSSFSSSLMHSSSAPSRCSSRKCLTSYASALYFQAFRESRAFLSAESSPSSCWIEKTNSPPSPRSGFRRPADCRFMPWSSVRTSTRLCAPRASPGPSPRAFLIEVRTCWCIVVPPSTGARDVRAYRCRSILRPPARIDGPGRSTGLRGSPIRRVGSTNVLEVRPGGRWGGGRWVAIIPPNIWYGGWHGEDDGLSA